MSKKIVQISRNIAAQLYHLPERKKIEIQYKKFCSLYKTKLDNNFSDLVVKYVAARQKGVVDYGFSESVNQNSLYSATYACLIKGLYTGFQQEERDKWIDYFNSCQREDGLFREEQYDDKQYYYGSGGWGACHLVPHLTIAYDRLNAKPKYEFIYLNKLKDPDTMIRWLSELDYKNIWASSNEIMNYGVAMQYARDRMGMQFKASLDAMTDFLLKKINSQYGMWYDGHILSNKDRNEMIRGAYHILPIFYYDKIEVPFVDRAIDEIIKSQNKWGGFDTYIASSACEDIDGLDLLLRLSTQANIKNEAIMEVVEKAKRWILFNQNPDGSFVFERNTPFTYGNQQILSSKADEGNLFATWFRCVSLEMIENYVNGVNNRLKRTPGYECPL